MSMYVMVQSILLVALVVVNSVSAQTQKVFTQKTVKEGAGEPAAKGDLIKVHYTGWLADSTRFDSSRDREEPLEFPLGAGMVIQGWEKGLIGMKPGEIRHFVIPPEMGYGDKAVGPIPENSTLLFEVELIEVQKGMVADELPKNWNTWAWNSMATGIEQRLEKAGTGVKAQIGNKLVVHYTGWLLGGTRFASSRPQVKPMEVVLGAGQVIRGWETGLVGMQKGEVRWLKVQPAQGYGTAALARIPPNSVLLFRVEAVDVDAEFIAEGLDIIPDVSKVQWKDGKEGLKYSVVQAPEDSTSEPAVVGKIAKVHYTGWLEDGTRFDSSRERGQPFEFMLGGGRVIRGWELGVEGMRAGEVRLLYIPASIGYGSRGTGPIPANATLVFQVEYLGSAE